MSKLLFENDGRRIFAIGFSFFLLAKVFLVVSPILTRSAPPDPDDGYSYAVRASQIIHCQGGDCPALESLRSQILRNPTEKGHSLELGELYNRIFVFTQPLYLFILAFLNMTGLSWESSLGLVSFFGILLICYSIAHWLYHFWGPGAAGLALLLLAFQTFNLEELSQVRGSNITLAITLLVWTILIKGMTKLMFWIPIGVATMLAMHNIGLAYALVTLVLVIFFAKKPAARQTKLVGASIFILISVLFIIRSVLTWPELSLRTDIFFAEIIYLDLLNKSIPAASATIRNWLISMWSIEFVLVLLSIGFLSARSIRRMAILQMLLILTSLFVGSIFFPLPLDPIEIFPRIWLPLAIFLTGAIGQGIWAWLRVLLGWTERIVAEDIPKLTDRRVLLSASGWNLLFVLLTGVVVLFSVGDATRSRVRSYFLTLESRTDITSLAFNPDQPDRLLSNIGDDEAVLYMRTVPMTYYLAKGAMQRPALLFQAFADRPDLDLWLDDGQTLGYLVDTNPIQKLPIIQNSDIRIENEDLIKILTPSDLSFSTLALYLVNPQPTEVHLSVEYTSETSQEEKLLVVPANWEGWLAAPKAFSQEHEPVAGIILSTKMPLLLGGIRLDQDQKLDWPWDKGVQLSYLPKGAEEAEVLIVTFESSQLSRSLGLSVQVIDDTGSSVLAKVID